MRNIMNHLQIVLWCTDNFCKVLLFRHVSNKSKDMFVKTVTVEMALELK